jgi:uncharacterized protein DUF6428
MMLAELKPKLAQNPDLPIRFYFPNGQPIAAHAHVTEVARIDKKFVDCGGTRRARPLCRLQTWVADDYDHRLKAGVLLKILDKAARILQTDDIEVDVEHEMHYITQFPIASVEPSDGETSKVLPPTPKYDFNPMKLQFKETARS